MKVEYATRIAVDEDGEARNRHEWVKNVENCCNEMGAQSKRVFRGHLLLGTDAYGADPVTDPNFCPWCGAVVEMEEVDHIVEAREPPSTSVVEVTTKKLA